MPKGTGFDFTKDNSNVLSYTSLDYDSLIQDLTIFAKTKFSDAWTDFSPGSFDYAWLSIMCYIGDLISYYINSSINETHILACKKLRNFMRMAAAYGYILPSTQSSKVTITIKSNVNYVPYILPFDNFKISNGTSVFMPLKTEIIDNILKDVVFISGELFVKDFVGISNGKKNQVFELQKTPVIDGSIIIYINNVTWLQISNLATAKSTDQVYVVSMDEFNRIDIIFGDNINGKIPALNAEIRVTYRIGGGVVDNCPANTITEIMTTLDQVISVTNGNKAEGGLDVLTLQKAKSNVVSAVTTNLRAVTNVDHSAILFDPRANPPSGIDKASSSIIEDTRYLFAIPGGGGTLSELLKSQISGFLKGVTTFTKSPIPRDVDYIDLTLTISAFIEKGYNVDDIVPVIRRLLITEDDTLEIGLFDYNNLGISGRDDAGTPQLTLDNIQDKLNVLKSVGLQKISIDLFSPIPKSKIPVHRPNFGNGFLSNFMVGANAVRRRFIVKWKNSTTFNVYQRIIGISTYLTDNSLVDDRLNIMKIPDIELNGGLYLGSVLNPNDSQTITVPIDIALSTASTVYKTGVNQSIFGLASTGDSYYIEFLDTANMNVGAVNDNVQFTAFNGLCRFIVNTGSIPFTAGDELIFDLYPQRGDILLKENEMPRFVKNDIGIATNLVVIPKTAE